MRDVVVGGGGFVVVGGLLILFVWCWWRRQCMGGLRVANHCHHHLTKTLEREWKSGVGEE